MSLTADTGSLRYTDAKHSGQMLRTHNVTHAYRREIADVAETVKTSTVFVDCSTFPRC